VPRTLLCFAAVAAFALPCRAEQTGTNTEMLIRLNVRPAPAPKPVLRYRLLPELKEMQPGNPIQNYMKCMMEQKKFFFDKEAFERREKLLAMPLTELPAQDVEEYGRYALTQADWAARLDTPDWQILPKLKVDGFETLLPEVQQVRSLARALQVRFRAEIAQCRFDDAIRTAKTMFAISRHLGEHPTVIGNLVGISIAYMITSHLEEMVQQPGCPNLYWAVTSLPSPFIRVDKGMEGERISGQWVFRDLDDTAPMSKDQLKKFLADKDKLLDIGEGKPGVRAWLDARTKDETFVTAGRRRLVEHGLPEERVLRFPADQVILLDEKREMEVRFDEEIKTVHFPFWQVDALYAQIKPKKPPAFFADALMPAFNAVRRAQVRIDQRLAVLRYIEALRLHAAEHNSTMPAKRSDLSVPVPDDPVTGKPFRYEVIGNTAHIHGSPPFGLEQVPQYNVHYEVALQWSIPQ
jgi:hypothetical protein